MFRLIRVAVATAIMAIPVAGIGSGVTEATQPSSVPLLTPGNLVSGILAWKLAPGGTYYQATTATEGQLASEFTLQLPAVDSAIKPGPVVLVWQLRLDAVDQDFGEGSSRIVADPEVAVAQPTCDASGNCAVRFNVDAATKAAADANKLASAAFNITAFRSFNDGAQIQIVEPWVAGDADAGTIQRPSDAYGGLNLSPVVDMDNADPGVIPNRRFGNSEVEYDWVSAVERSLSEFTPSPNPEEVPINVWTPDPADSLRVVLDIGFSDTCPASRTLVVAEDSTDTTAYSKSISGRRSVEDTFALPALGSWSVSLQTGSGAAINSTTLDDDPWGVRVEGPMTCANGKGVFTQSGLQPSIPNPSVAPNNSAGPSASPTARTGVGSPSGHEDEPPSVALALIGIGILLVGGFIIASRWWLPSRRAATSRANATGQRHS